MGALGSGIKKISDPTTHHPHAHIVVRMLTRDLFSPANLFLLCYVFFSYSFSHVRLSYSLYTADLACDAIAIITFAHGG